METFLEQERTSLSQREALCLLIRKRKVQILMLVVVVLLLIAGIIVFKKMNHTTSAIRKSSFSNGCDTGSVSSTFEFADTYQYEFTEGFIDAIELTYRTRSCKDRIYVQSLVSSQLMFDSGCVSTVTEKTGYFIVSKGETAFSVTMTQCDERFCYDPNDVSSHFELTCLPVNRTAEEMMTNESWGYYTYLAEDVSNVDLEDSRDPQYVSENSGVTIGRGYDMKERKKGEIFRDMKNAGVPTDVANALEECRGLHGDAARNKVEELKDDLIFITENQQLRLFRNEFEASADSVRVNLRKPELAQRYNGTVNVDSLPNAVVEFLTDLRFRGDYTTSSRETIVPAILDAQKKTNWKGFWDKMLTWNSHCRGPNEERKRVRRELINDRRRQTE